MVMIVVLMLIIPYFLEDVSELLAMIPNLMGDFILVGQEQ
jgi:hypothetical protein